jgi:hypothetical protein
MAKPLAFWCYLLLATAAASAAEVDYLRDVKPILRERCFACHGALKQEAGLRVDTAAALKQGGDSGAALQPGDTGASLLWERIIATDESYRMPPEGKPLEAAELASIRVWIEQSAPAPDDELPETDPNQHWSFQPPVRPPIPAPHRSGSAQPLNPIDAFLDAGRRARQLQTVPEADRGLLLRRVHLDLIGVPPTRQELHEFLADERTDALERVVERLLDSPHYGERWGRHWMDVWRYTDWYGLGDQLRNSQKHIWHWRDWIIQSLNEDQGYDRMVQQMLAADELAPNDASALRATGFLARNYYLFNRTTWLDETIEHTGKAFLGLTLNCAKCHDHKYDPLTQDDYYRWRAVFEPHQVRLDPLPGEINLEKNGLPRVFDAHPDAPTYVHLRGDEKQPLKDRVVPPGPPGFLLRGEFQPQSVALPAAAHNPSLQSFVLEDHVAAAEREIAAARQTLEQARAKLAQATALAAKSETHPEETRENSSEVFVQDDFAMLDESVWEIGPGEWKHAEGRLTQTQTGAERRWLRTRQPPPQDFEAVLRFKTLGGQMWKSVGVCFDMALGREKVVYLSAVSSGSKVQVSFNQGGGSAYPAQGKQDRPVELNKPYELTVRLRGDLVNVAIDGQHAVAYRFPFAREAGGFEIFAFDAAAEFSYVKIRALPEEVALVEAGASSEAPLTPELAQHAVALAEKTLAAAELRPEVLRTAHNADAAKVQPAPPENLAALVRAAALAARRHELAKAEEAVLRAEQKVAQAAEAAKAPAEKELQAAHEAREKARLAVEEPGEAYPSLQASLKALEGPDETEASRRQPYPTISTGRRAALAQWLTARDNPLTARVAVNHIWTRHFGQPLVESMMDFGRRAPPPAQQELLDWLAIEFMESGWSMKHMHRLMVLSQAYRLSSSSREADSATLAADPENHYFWRRQPMRMESQAVRDSLLHLAGVLNPTMGGPTLDPTKDDTLFRRSLYFTHSRDDQHAFLSMFDDADIVACYRRSESIVPQQALTLANSKLSLDMARRLAAKLPAERDQPHDDAFLTAAYETILCTSPTPDELAACRDALAQMQTVLRAQGHKQPVQRARENLVHALLNHNDFITIR